MRPKRSAAPPIGVDEWLSKLEALGARSGLRPRELATAFIGREVDGVSQASVESAAALLARYDLTWGARLLIVARAERSRKSVVLGLAARAVVDGRALTSFPSLEAESSAPFRWIADTIGSETPAVRGAVPALPLVALWPEARRQWFAFAVVAVLTSWAGSERPKMDVRKATVAIATSATAAGRVRVAQLHAFISEYEASARRQEIRADEAIRERDQAQRQRQLSGQQASQLVGRVTELEARLAEAERELSAARTVAAEASERHASELRLAQVVASNRLGELTGRVRSVLERELTEIRLYLERNEPNVAAAVARLRYIEELRDELSVGERSA